jgi:bifunctional DNA-binding transcriptional regulator/antitoxin component of YhaV-PrlF toxin-antitoxin module
MQAQKRLMGYLIKVQKVDRPTNRSYYVNLPVVLAESLGIQKGDEFEWLIEDKNTLLLSRVTKKAPRKLRSQ